MPVGPLGLLPMALAANPAKGSIVSMKASAPKMMLATARYRPARRGAEISRKIARFNHQVGIPANFLWPAP